MTPQQPKPRELVYKICPRGAWEAAVQIGHYAGSEDDLRDGFIHLSAAHQVAATAAKYFRGKDDLVLVGVDAAQVGAALRWEPSRGGDLFPHLYAMLPVDAAGLVVSLPLGPDGVPCLPEPLA